MNFIGLDISKISTAMSIENTEGENFLFNYTTKEPNYLWIKRTSEVINYRYYNYNNCDVYSESEIDKLNQFVKISNDVIKDIKETITDNYPVYIMIEGYSYGKQQPGPIIDLVGIGSIIRCKILENIENVKLIEIIAPKSLKTKTCEYVYGYEMVEKGKRVVRLTKVVNTNDDGISGNDFKKHDMFKALLDAKLEVPVLEFYEIYKDDLLKMKTLPKPFDDINDAIFCKDIIKNNILSA